jgi:hypothetical protein
MTTDRKEPVYLFTEKQVAEKSELARKFLDTRSRQNENVDQADNFLVKRSTMSTTTPISTARCRRNPKN